MRDKTWEAVCYKPFHRILAIFGLDTDGTIMVNYPVWNDPVTLTIQERVGR